VYANEVKGLRRRAVEKIPPRRLYGYQKNRVARIGVCKWMKRQGAVCSVFERSVLCERVRKTGRKARDSVRGVGVADCIEYSHQSIVYIYLLVKINRKYKKRRRIGGRLDDRGKLRAGISEDVGLSRFPMPLR
jgi:hypothetical protein